MSENTVPKNVIVALAEVRESGAYNMFDRRGVIETAEMFDEDAANWLEENKPRYMDALNEMGAYITEHPNWRDLEDKPASRLPDGALTPVDDDQPTYNPATNWIVNPAEDVQQEVEVAAEDVTLEQILRRANTRLDEILADRDKAKAEIERLEAQVEELESSADEAQAARLQAVAEAAAFKYALKEIELRGTFAYKNPMAKSLANIASEALGDDALK